MALIDNYNAALANDNQFMQRLTIQIAVTVLSVLGGSPTAPQQALGKRFLLAPQAEAQRYLIPVAAKIVANGGSFASDTDLATAVNQVLTINVGLGIS